jgi:hypothetical protein
VLMSMMTIRARKRVTCVTAGLMLVVEAVGAGLRPSAFWGSWCILGQTHETSHVDGACRWARLCIYLMASLAADRLNSFPGSKMMEVPSDGSRLMAKIAPVAPIETVLAVSLKMQSVDAVFACRSSSIWEAAIVCQAAAQKWEHQGIQKLLHGETSFLRKLPELVEVVMAEAVRAKPMLVVKQFEEYVVVQRTLLEVADRPASSPSAYLVTFVLALGVVLADERLVLLLYTAGSIPH